MHNESQDDIFMSIHVYLIMSAPTTPASFFHACKPLPLSSLLPGLFFPFLVN